ncbi:hypothetical protein QF042_001856 [Pedobacter sp. W3I1]|nr:hypothetical protein [Pedobacter sp. W3I1]
MLRAIVYMHETPDTAIQKNIFFRINRKVLFNSVLFFSVEGGINNNDQFMQ